MGCFSRMGRHARRNVLVGILSALLILVPPSFALAQLPALPTPNVSETVPMARPPAGVELVGNLEVAPVRFEGQELFKVAAPRVRDRANPGDQIPVELRAEQIESSLNRIIQDNLVVSESGIQNSTNYDPETLKVYISIFNGETVIFAEDEGHPQPLKLLTVTQADADYYGLPIRQVAEYMRDLIYENLVRALKERTLEAISQNLVKAGLILAGTLGIHLLLLLLIQLLRYRDQALTALQTQNITAPGEAAISNSMPPQSASVRGTGHATKQGMFSLTLSQRRTILSLGRWLLSWGQFLAWLIGIAMILRLFPWTRPLSSQILRVPLALVTLWFSVGLLNRLGDFFLERVMMVWRDYREPERDSDPREILRISTTLRVLKGLKTALLYFIAATWALGLLGVPVGSVLAIGGIFAFAISLGFQNVVRDVVNGCLILWEDQYAIGDIISIGTDEGLVENMNLRITQLRNFDGQLITIPNSSITVVRNHTRMWSRVNFAVDVAYDTDVDHALSIIRMVTEQMQQDDEWGDRILEPPEVLGVDSLSHTGIQIRVWIKTQPGMQWLVGRELRRRVRLALDRHNIAIGKPQQDMWYRNALSLMHQNGSSVSDVDVADTTDLNC